MAPTSVYLAEEALALPAEERYNLAKLLMDSLIGDVGTDEETRAALLSRLENLKNGRDLGLSFEEVFSVKK